MPRLLKDKQITVNWYNDETRDYEARGPYWAHYRSLSVSEMYGSGAHYGYENCYFTITRPSDYEITTYDKIIYKGVEYDIENIDLFENRTECNIRIQASRKI